jgi:tetratricopeptide (TPR) repeat protein
LSQAALSERTDRLPFPLTEAYISHQENGAISSSVSVDLRYAAYLGADVHVIRELVTIRPLLPSAVKQGGSEETLRRIIDSSRRRDDRRAMGECVAWIRRTPDGDPAIAKALLCSSIVMSNRGANRSAAFLANAALTVRGCDEPTKHRAIIQLAHVQSMNGLDGVVDRIFDRLPAATKSDLASRLLHTGNRGMALLRRNKPIEATYWLEQTRALLGKDNEPAQSAATWVLLAEAYGLAGRRDEANAALDQALQFLGEVSPPLRGHIECNAGDAAVKAKLFDLAIECFNRAYSTAREEQIPPLEFRAMLSRCEVALRSKDQTAARRELRDLKRRVQAVAHNPGLLRRFWKLLDTVNGLNPL